jgi:hypothetical protein
MPQRATGNTRGGAGSTSSSIETRSSNGFDHRIEIREVASDLFDVMEDDIALGVEHNHAPVLIGVSADRRLSMALSCGTSAVT